MGEIKITRKLLDNYRKLKREIPVLSMELAEMKQGEAGLGNSTIFDYTTGFARPQSVVGFDQARYDRRKHTYDHKMAQAAAVERWIQSIEDGQTRYVFKAFLPAGNDLGEDSRKDRIFPEPGLSKALYQRYIFEKM